MNLGSQKAEIQELIRKQSQLDNHRAEIEDLQAKLTEEQEKVIALETYSRRENLRFMNIPPKPDENCIDTIYDIIENELNINTDNMHFQAVHRVGLNAKVVNRNLIVNNAVFHVGNIPPESKSPWSSCNYWIHTTSSVLLEKIANRNACLSHGNQLLSLFIISYGRVLPNPV